VTLKRSLRATFTAGLLSLSAYGLVGVPAVEAASNGFSTSCKSAATKAISRGVVDLHNMMFATSRIAFIEAKKIDNECAMAVWGIAMSYIHPVWIGRSTEEQRAAMQDNINQAVEKGIPTERERAYLETVRAFFKGDVTRSKKERLIDYMTAFRKIYQDYPDDLDGQSFYALALLSTADRKDKSYAIQMAAGAIAEKILKSNPNHNGALHNIIHSYDLPGLAPRALSAAQTYGKVAPQKAHPLHMGVHIFTRLGLWKESDDWSRRAAAAALKDSVARGEQDMNFPHSLDYLGYAKLQSGSDNDARALITEIYDVDLPYSMQLRGAMAYAYATLPARVALETRNWAEAAALKPRQPAKFPWEGMRFQQFVAATHFARAIGLAHEGNLEAARSEINTLKEIQQRVAKNNVYWAGQVEIQAVSSEAWVELRDGNQSEALKLMYQAAALEDATEKHAVTPGSVLPARELLGDMLLETGDNSGALEAYEATLVKIPARLNSLYGALLAHERLGNMAKAEAYYGKIMALTSEADAKNSARTWLPQLVKRFGS